MLKLLGLIPSLIKTYAMPALLVVALGIGTFAYNAVWQRGWDAHVATAEVEKRRLREANERAIAAADQELTAKIKLIEAEKERLENAAAKIELEADADINADSCGISDDSVQRLNTLR